MINGVLSSSECCKQLGCFIVELRLGALLELITVYNLLDGIAAGYYKVSNPI